MKSKKREEKIKMIKAKSIKSISLFLKEHINNDYTEIPRVVWLNI